MKNMLFISFLFLLFSCQQDKKMQCLKTISFDIGKDVYVEGYSDADEPFLYFAGSDNNVLYKYYINSIRKDSIDLEKETKIKYFNNYFVIFNKEDYVLYHHFQIYNSVTDKLYQLDSLSGYNGMEYMLSCNNVNSWKNNSLLITNWFTCGLLKKDHLNEDERRIACKEYKQNQPSYSMLDFNKNKLNLSKMTLNSIRPSLEPKNDLSTIWFSTTSIFVNDMILYSNHYIDAVYESNKKGVFKKVFTVTSKYTKFDKEDKKEDRREMLDYAIGYATKVNSVLYDEYRKKILVVLVHGTKDFENNGEKKRTNRPFSILVYNEKYELENEYLFDSLKHDFNNIYVCKEGLIINANNKLSNNYEPQKLIYEIFTY